MDETVVTILKAARLRARLRQTLAAHPEMQWVAIDADGDVWCYQSRPIFAEDMWVERPNDDPEGRRGAAQVGTLHALCRRYPEAERASRSAGWCYPAKPLLACLYPVRSSHAVTTLQPLLAAWAERDDFWL